MTLKSLLRRAVTKLGSPGLAGAAGQDTAREALPGSSDADDAIIRSVRFATMTSPQRIQALIDATRYIVRADVPGAIVECGVWRGGSMMAVAHVLMELGERRELYLFDTYAGMTEPSGADVDPAGTPAMSEYLSTKKDDHTDWCFADLDEVKANLESTGYPMELCHFIMGDVKDTLPADQISDIAILRLDTDWYDTTLHELKCLYQSLVRRGVMIIDDYGHWAGCRKAVHEYFGDNLPLLVAVDNTGRVAVRTD